LRVLNIIANPVYVKHNEKRPIEIETFNRVADVTRARQILNYKPRISLREDIKGALSGIRKNRKLTILGDPILA